MDKDGTPPVVGHVDGTTHGTMSGWAFDPSRPADRVTVEISHDGEPICRVLADRYREDLLEAGLGDGHHGFTLNLPLEMFTEPSVVLRVRDLHTGIELVGSPLRLRNHNVVVDDDALRTFRTAIEGVVEAAQSSSDLQALAAWLIARFDTVYQRQRALEASGVLRTQQFALVIGDNGRLSEFLRHAATELLARYAPLHFEEVSCPDVSVIVAAFDHFDYTYRCLRSIIEHLPKSTIEVVLVDDGSTDQTVYASLIFSGGIRIVRNSCNMGFLRSSMAGAGIARGGLLLFLNNDTEVTEGWLDELVATTSQDPAIGLVGSKFLYPDGRLQEAGGIIWRQGNGWNWGRQQDADDPRFCFMRDTDYVSGACLLVRRSIFDEVGGFSDEFSPAYYEDTDLCFKVRAAGYRVVVQPYSRIVHHEGISSGTDVGAGGAKRHQRINQRVFLRKWFATLQAHCLNDSDPQAAADRTVGQRALFIDDTVPTPDRDAGSNAAFEHIQSLQRLGYQVHFVGADNMAKISPYTDALERLGVQNYYAPYFWSVEELFRREPAKFDLFYIHRMMNVVKYAPMIRQRYPAARVVFNVADLHHLRLGREALVKECPELLEAARAARDLEIAAIKAVDAVIVHSTFERDLLGNLVPDADVHVVPWVVRSTPTPVPFSDRRGLAFIGGYNHTPNVDAALWLVREVMPLVHAQDPTIECMLIGSNMPETVMQLAREGVRPLGHVRDLNGVLQRLRLTVAPLRYGAGLKGKVLTSLAVGLPCAATACAIEGMELPEILSRTAATAEDFAALILKLHADESHNGMLAAAGLQYIAEHYTQAKVDALLYPALVDRVIAPIGRVQSSRRTGVPISPTHEAFDDGAKKLVKGRRLRNAAMPLQ